MAGLGSLWEGSKRPLSDAVKVKTQLQWRPWRAGLWDSVWRKLWHRMEPAPERNYVLWVMGLKGLRCLSLLEPRWSCHKPQILEIDAGFGVVLLSLTSLWSDLSFLDFHSSLLEWERGHLLCNIVSVSTQFKQKIQQKLIMKGLPWVSEETGLGEILELLRFWEPLTAELNAFCITMHHEPLRTRGRLLQWRAMCSGCWVDKGHDC